MDFVPIAYGREEKRRTRRSILTRLGIGSVFVSQAPLFVAVGVEGTWMAAPLTVALFGTIFTMLSIVMAPEELERVRKQDRTERIRVSLNEHYGLNLSSDQFASLSYPEVNPGSEFQTFGSIKVQDQVDGANFLERTLYLTATDGELKLSESRDGKRFKELKPARHAVEGSTSSPRTALESPRSTIEAQATPLSVSV